MFFRYEIIPKLLELKIKSVLVKESLIFTKVGLRKVEHLQQKEIFFRDPYFSMLSHIIATHLQKKKKADVAATNSEVYIITISV